MDSNKSLWVLIVPYSCLRILMGPSGPYRSLYGLMDSSGSLWVLIGPDASLLVFMGPF